MAQMADLLASILPEVHGCPDVRAQQAAVNAAITFCRFTNCWKRDLDPMTTQAGVAQYDVSGAVSDGVLNTLLSGTVDHLPLAIRTRDELDDRLPYWRTYSGFPTTVFLPNGDRNTIQLVGVPDQAYTVQLTASYKPTPTATTLDDAVFNDFYKAMADGALAELLLMNGRGWFNPVLGAQHQAAFNAAMHDARVETDMGNGRSRNMVQMRPFI